jgi:hypothetical protein
LLVGAVPLCCIMQLAGSLTHTTPPEEGHKQAHCSAVETNGASPTLAQPIFFFLNGRGVSKDPEAASYIKSGGYILQTCPCLSRIKKIRLANLHKGPQKETGNAIGSSVFSTDGEPRTSAALTPSGTNHLMAGRRELRRKAQRGPPHRRLSRNAISVPDRAALASTERGCELVHRGESLTKQQLGYTTLT